MDSQITPEPDTTLDETPARPLPWKGMGITLTVFALVILCLAYWTGMLRVIHLNKKVVAVTSSLDSIVSRNQSDIATLQRSVSDLQQNLQQTQDQLSTDRNTMVDLKAAYTSKSDDWTIADAHYLVKTADVNLQLGDNVALVIRLLQAANQELGSVVDSKITPIRKALADDILSLQALPAQDTTGIYLQLNALNTEVDKLPLIQPRASTAQPITISPQAPWWKRGWQATLNGLQKIVIVRYSEPGVRPFILPDQQELLFQNIHAMLYQAMTAVVHKQPQIYSASLLQAKAWIEKYFQPDSPLTQAQLKDLEKLQAVNLRPTLPTLTAVQAFHDYNATQGTSSAASGN